MVRIHLPPPLGYAGVAQLVEHQPSKLRVASSNLVSRSIAHVAQLVERILGKDEVTGSNPVMGSMSRVTPSIFNLHISIQPSNRDKFPKGSPKWPKKNLIVPKPT